MKVGPRLPPTLSRHGNGTQARRTPSPTILGDEQNEREQSSARHGVTFATT